MNLTIKDLSASTELDQAAMTAVRGGTGPNGNAAVSNIGQFQVFNTSNVLGTGAGSAVNNDVTVTGTQDASIDTDQNIGDVFSLLVGIRGGLRRI
jgi:hypothetical protein